MEGFVVGNMEYISVAFISFVAFATNMKIYRMKSAMTLSYRPYMFGIFASFVVLINSQTEEMGMVMAASLFSSMISMLHIIYRKRGGCSTRNDDSRIFLIALIGSSLGVFGSSLAYLSLVNLKKGRSSVSMAAIFVGIINYAIMILFLAKDWYVVFSLSITIALQFVILLATYYNNNYIFKKKRKVENNL